MKWLSVAMVVLVGLMAGPVYASEGYGLLGASAYVAPLVVVPAVPVTLGVPVVVDEFYLNAQGARVAAAHVARPLAIRAAGRCVVRQRARFCR